MALEQDQEFLRSIDIVAVVSEFVTLRRHGREFQGLCPFHSERTPSFSVNPEKGFWYCHGCHEGGNAITFLAKVEGISNGQAIRALAERQGVALPTGGGTALPHDDKQRDRLLAACAEAARFYAEQLNGEGAEAARTYLRTRGIDRSCATSFGLGFAPGTLDTLYRRLLDLGYTLEETEEAGLCSRGEYGPYDRMRMRLIIPVADAQGRIIAFGGRAIGDGTPKYLNSPETALFHKSRTLYLLHRARKAIQKENTVVVVEGYLDALMAHFYGIENVVATLGTAITPQHVKLLQRLAKRVIFSLDSDEAGARAVEKSTPLFEDTGMEIAIASFPAGMDPDAYLRKFGPDEFRARLKSAVGVVEFRLVTTLQKADLSSPDGKMAAIQECTKVLASLKSGMLRDRYVDDLARLWAGAQAAGESHTDTIDLVRKEIVRQVRQNLFAQKGTASRQVADSTSGKTQLESDLEHAEAELMAALFKHPALMTSSVDGLSVSDFHLPVHRTLFTLLQERGGPEEWLSSLEDGDTVGAAAKILAASEAIMDENAVVQQLFVDCLRKIRDFDKRLRFEELRHKFYESAEKPDSIQPEELGEYYSLSLYFKTGALDAAAVQAASPWNN